MTKKRSVLESQGCVIAMLGLTLALAGPIFDRGRFALGFSAVFGFVLAIAGGALYLWAPKRMRIAESTPERASGTENWPTSTDRLVTICMPTSDAEQVFVESLLRGQGIPFVTQNSNAQLAMGEPEIQVSAADLRRARRVVRALETKPPQNEGGGGAS